MSSKLTTQQKTLVEQNMGLVARVLNGCVHNPNQCGIYTYDDLYQYGCIGLCNAAATYEEGRQATFETYAYLLIRNEIFKQLEYATRRKQREFPMAVEDIYCDIPQNPDQEDDISALLDAVASKASGVVAKGIEAIRMQAQGYSCKEIGQHFGGVSANNVSAWVSRARKLLQQDPAFREFGL